MLLRSDLRSISRRVVAVAGIDARAVPVYVRALPLNSLLLIGEVVSLLCFAPTRDCRGVLHRVLSLPLAIAALCVA
jgi:hypothetical protein